MLKIVLFWCICSRGVKRNNGAFIIPLFHCKNFRYSYSIIPLHPRICSVLPLKNLHGIPTWLYSTWRHCFTISQCHSHAQSLKVTNSSEPLDNQTWQTEWKTAPLVKVLLCEVRKPNFGSFCCGQQFVCQVWLFSGRQKFHCLLRMIVKLAYRFLPVSTSPDLKSCISEMKIVPKDWIVPNTINCTENEAAHIIHAQPASTSLLNQRLAGMFSST